MNNLPNEWIIKTLSSCMRLKIPLYVQNTISFAEDELKYIFKEILSGLRYIHRRKVAHLDIKLDNILFDKDFHVKICDFGLA